MPNFLHNADGSMNMQNVAIICVVIIIMTVVAFKYGSAGCPYCGLKYKCKCTNNKCGCKTKYGVCQCN